jgi:hypothetical protein
MLHIATAHFEDPRWIPVQARELRRHLTAPYWVWASLEGIALEGIDGAYDEHLHHLDRGSGRHAEKLNRLAVAIASEASDDDLLMFLDGDAFPIADPMPLIESGLEDAPLIAVRRPENGGDPQPHPCFCVTRVGFWRDLPGDWSEGFTWTGPVGKPETDAGANMLRRLEETGTPWTSVLRSNRHDLHPVFFGVYGDVIYHHGAGFRVPFSRADLAQLSPDDSPHSPAVRELLASNRQASEEMFERIRRDDPDWLAELGGGL